MPYRAAAKNGEECIRVAADYSLRPSVLCTVAVYVCLLMGLVEFSWESVLAFVMAGASYLARDFIDRRLVRSVCMTRDGRFFGTTWYDYRKGRREWLHEIERERLSVRRRMLVLRSEGYTQQLFLTDQGQRLLEARLDIGQSSK